MTYLLLRSTYLMLAALSLAAASASGTYAAEAEQPVPLSRGSFLGIQQAVEIAVKNHPMLIEGQANLKASEARTEQARGTRRGTERSLPGL